MSDSSMEITTIPNVTSAQNNIHAGVKILKTIADQYLSDPKIDPRNRLLLTFASYNAGPNRIAALRKEAPRRGSIPTSGSAMRVAGIPESGTDDRPVRQRYLQVLHRLQAGGRAGKVPAIDP